MSISLRREELEQFAGKTERAQKRYNLQAKELDALRIPYMRRSDKTLIALRRHVDERDTHDTTRRASNCNCIAPSLYASGLARTIA